MTADFPAKVRFLFEPHDYKVLFGGRDGIKSWSMARALLLLGAQHQIRWLCARETQKSIGESVHRLLQLQIAELGLESLYRVEKARIIGTVEHATGMYGRPRPRPGFTEFVFAGLKHNVNEIKSFESLDGAWIEEAENVSKNSWEVVLPTIRKEGSEIWASFNPKLATDDTYVRWVLNPPEGAVVVRTSYLDNLWLSDTSRRKIEAMRLADPETFEHIYGGTTRSSEAGAIYYQELLRAEKENRITRVPYDASKPVHTFWDLGFGDETAIWMAQSFPFEFRLIDCLSDSRQPLAYYLKELQSRPYVYGTDYLPWDGAARSLGTGRSIEELMRGAGRTVEVVPQLRVADGINAARTIFPQCWFDGEKCEDGLQALRHYKYGEIATLGTPTREPVHDAASHFSDAFRTFAVGIRRPEQPRPYTPPTQRKTSWMA